MTCKAHVLLTVWPFPQGLVAPPEAFPSAAVLSFSCCFSLKAGGHICGQKTVWELESSLGSALTGRDLAGSRVFVNWRLLISQMEVIE